MENRTDILEAIEQAKKEVVLAELKLIEFDIKPHDWAENFGDVKFFDLSDFNFNSLTENMRTYNKLQTLRYQIIKDWRPDYKKYCVPKYAVGSENNKLIPITVYNTFAEFTFKTAEQRDWFMTQHIDLLNIYYGITGVPNK